MSDEVHHFNKSQQDAFLPHLESGLFALIGATTENPSFELNRALLSRLTVFVLHSLDDTALAAVARRAAARAKLNLSDDVVRELCALADGDARRLLNILENAAADEKTLSAEGVRRAAGVRARRFDKGGDNFYDQISALHKSVRGSDPDAALYWFCRMLDGGADPRYIGRRLVRIASEDIGLADPRALGLTLEADAAFRRLGAPEGELALAQVAVYLACAPKSDAVYAAFKRAAGFIKNDGSRAVPPHLRNAPTRLLKRNRRGKRISPCARRTGRFCRRRKLFSGTVCARRDCICRPNADWKLKSKPASPTSAPATAAPQPKKTNCKKN